MASVASTTLSPITTQEWHDGLSVWTSQAPSAAIRVLWPPSDPDADGLLDARRLGSGALRVLTNLAHRTPAHRQIEPKTARRALYALATAGIVSRGTGRGEWAITDPLFADYLSRVPFHP